jgi:hypothetical protein
MIYIYTKFRKDWVRHSKVNRRGYIDTQTAWRSHEVISVNIFIYFLFSDAASNFGYLVPNYRVISV